MSTPEPLGYDLQIDFNIDSRLLKRVTSVLVRNELTFGDCVRSGFGLLDNWDRQRAIGEQIALASGVKLIDAGIIEGTMEPYMKSLMKIGDMVENEKGTYNLFDRPQTIYATEEFGLNLDLLALSRGYPSRDFVFRDAALFFCNVNEMFDT